MLEKAQCDNDLVIVKMMPESSIHYLMSMFRVFLFSFIKNRVLVICVVASTENGIDMKYFDSLYFHHSYTYNDPVFSFHSFYTCNDQTLKLVFSCFSGPIFLGIIFLQKYK